MNIYDFINWSFIYGLLGYLLECIVLSAEYRRLVVDHGFGHSPSCVTYGFGALGACILLRPVPGSPMEPYTAPTTMATTMEPVTANITVRLFGSFQWNYNRKPFSYKGMICLESSLARGLLDLLLFYSLGIKIRVAVISLSGHVGTVLAVGFTMSYLMDFTHCFRLHIGSIEEGDEPAVGRLKIY